MAARFGATQAEKKRHSLFHIRTQTSPGYALTGLSYAPLPPDYDALDRLEERLRDDREADGAVFDAIKILELDALHSPGVSQLEPDDTAAGFLVQVDDISGLIWQRIERW